MISNFPTIVRCCCVGALLTVAVSPLAGQTKSTSDQSFESLADSVEFSGLQILRQSIRAHGGNVYEDHSTLAASFSGRWGRIGPRLQPILADKSFRVASEERYLLHHNSAFQWHVGPDGEKIVFREHDRVAVHYNGRPSRDPNRLLASAATADLYQLLLIGPSWFTQREATFVRLDVAKLGGEPHIRVEATIEPGIGKSDRDRLVLWFNERTSVLQRVETTLAGYPLLEGRNLEVTLGGHTWLSGKLWPTEFLQRVDGKVKVVYHRWQMTGFEVDREFEPAELASIRRSRLDLDALRPPEAISHQARP